MDFGYALGLQQLIGFDYENNSLRIFRKKAFSFYMDAMLIVFP
jgi:hypothetical protein